MNYDLTTGSITGKIIRFSIPLMAGNLLQQFYNLADTLIVGRYIGSDALAAVGSSYTLMTFLTSIILGLCMGSSAYFSIQFGKKDNERLKNGMFLSFCIIGIFSLVLNILVFAAMNPIISFLNIPISIVPLIKEYLIWIFAGIMATFLYNYFANLLRAVGNSFVPLIFLGVASVLNIILDLLFVVVFHSGVAGAAIATVISQYIAGMGIAVYCYLEFPQLHIDRSNVKWNKTILKDVFGLSFLTCVQQSVMNFGILLVQGLVNSFGTVVMAAFAAAVKIDTIAYMPVQDFGNAFSTFVAQNYGAGKYKRIEKGIRSSVICVFLFCSVISLAVCIFAKQLMGIFISPADTEIILCGVGYLRIEAAFYFGIGLLFMLYGYYRAVNKPGMSVVLTICSLGIRVVLAYALSANQAIGVSGIWAAIPIGWFIADLVGVVYYLKKRNSIYYTE